MTAIGPKHMRPPMGITDTSTAAQAKFVEARSCRMIPVSVLCNARLLCLPVVRPPQTRLDPRVAALVALGSEREVRELSTTVPVVADGA